MSRHTVWSLQEAGAILVEDGNHGEQRPRPNEFVDAGLSFIRAADMTSGVVDFSRAARINEVASGRIRKGIGAPGDVLLSHKGTVGKVARAPLDAPAFVCSPQTTFYRSLDPNVLDQRYLYFFLLSEDFQRQLASRQGETDMAPYVSLTAQRRLELELPPIGHQQRIAGVLGALDELIEADLRVADAVDDAVAESWNRAASTCGETVRLGEICVVRKGLSYKGAALRESGVPLLNMGNFGVDGRFREAGIKFYEPAPTDLRKALHLLDLVVANTDLTQKRDILARPLLVPQEGALSTHHTFQFAETDLNGGQAWLYGFLRQETVRKRLIATATGTTVAALPQSVLEDLDVPWPGAKEVSAWAESAKVAWLSALDLRREAAQLRATRDELLPLLMSGKVSPGDVTV